MIVWQPWMYLYDRAAVATIRVEKLESVCLLREPAAASTARDREFHATMLPSVTCYKADGPLLITCKDNPFGQGGVVISALGRGSVAAGLLHIGDVVLTINGHHVNGHQDAVVAIDSAENETVFELARLTRVVHLVRLAGTSRAGGTCEAVLKCLCHHASPCT